MDGFVEGINSYLNLFCRCIFRIFARMSTFRYVGLLSYVEFILCDLCGCGVDLGGLHICVFVSV